VLVADEENDDEPEPEAVDEPAVSAPACVLVVVADARGDAESAAVAEPV